MNLRQTIAGLVLSSCLVVNVRAISEQQAGALATATSLIGACTTYATMNASSGSVRKALYVAAAAGVCGLLGGFTFSHFTPFGRYTRAMNIVNAASQERLLTHSFSSYDQLKTHLKLTYNNDWYLVSGKESLRRWCSDLSWAKSMLQHARSESSATLLLIQLCGANENVIDVFLRQYEHLMVLIDSNQEEYYRQRKAYDAYLKRRQFEAMMNQKERHHWDNSLQKAFKAK